MARSIDELTGKYAIPCYLEPLRHAHATVQGLQARIKQDGDALSFDPGPTREEADTALMMAHMLMLNVCTLFLEHFQPAGLEDLLRKALDDYSDVWDLPRQDPDDNGHNSGTADGSSGFSSHVKLLKEWWPGTESNRRHADFQGP